VIAMYTYDIGAQSMFDDRTAQFEKFGISLDDINSVRSRVTDMWADEPGGWVPRMVEARRALRRQG
jgi:esterase FrsA